MVATVTTGKSGRENSHKSSPVSRYPCQDVWHVSMNGLNHTNMVSFIAERDFLPTKTDRRDKFPIKHGGFQVWGGKAEKFCLLRNQLHMVLGTIFDGEVEKVLQLEDAVTNQTGIISLANGGNKDPIQGNSKLGELSSGKLLIVSQFVESITQTSTLLDTK